MTTYSHSGLKNMGAQTDSGATPAVQATNTYDAFGGVQASTGSWQGPFGTAGAFGYQTEPSGLHLLGHRYYDASTGRFLTRDPKGDGGNWYAYCGNDPLAFVDAAGLYRLGYDAFSDFMAGWGVALTPPGPISLLIGPDPWTKRFRGLFGYDDNVEYDGGWYGGGWWTGFGHSILIGELGKVPIGRVPKAVPEVPIKARLAQPDLVVHGPRLPHKNGPPNGVGARFTKGKLAQVRVYDESGDAIVDIDWGHNHGAGDPHWTPWIKGVREKGGGRSFKE